VDSITSSNSYSI